MQFVDDVNDSKQKQHQDFYSYFWINRLFVYIQNAIYFFLQEPECLGLTQQSLTMKTEYLKP